MKLRITTYLLIMLITFSAFAQGMDIGSTERNGCDHLVIEEEDLVVALTNNNAKVKIVSTAVNLNITIWDYYDGNWEKVRAEIDPSNGEIELGDGEDLIGKTVALKAKEARKLELMKVQQEDGKAFIDRQKPNTTKYVHFVGSDGNCLPK